MTPIKRVGVCGFGLVGAGVVEVAARSGFQTTVLVKSAGHASSGNARLEASTARAVKRGVYPEQARQSTLALVSCTTDVAAMGGCDMVIEAVSEDLGVKQALFASLGAACGPLAILASTTSSLSIGGLAGSAPHPGRVVGLHFFNPVPIMKLVEVVRSDTTSSATLSDALAFVQAVGKTPIVVRDTPGFLVNRLTFAYLMDAARLAQSGAASCEDIDTAMRLGCNFPVGPFELMRVIGVPTVINIARNLRTALGDERFRPVDGLEEIMKLYEERAAARAAANR